jgi:hypothetical protein
MPVSIGNADIERIVKAVVQSMDRNTTDKSLVVPGRQRNTQDGLGAQVQRSAIVTFVHGCVCLAGRCSG